jgi:hypothetical protein
MATAVFIGDITINSITDGSSGVTNNNFAGIGSTDSQVITGTTTVFNAQITVSIYLDQPANLPLPTLPPSTPAPSPPVQNPNPVFQNSVTAPADIASGAAQAWTFTIPASTLNPTSSYVILAQADASAMAAQPLATQ